MGGEDTDNDGELIDGDESAAEVGGEISAMYMGEMADARPIPIPPRRRKRIKGVKELTAPVPMAEARNKAAATMSGIFLPYLSESCPEKSAPKTQPIRALLMAHPWRLAEWVISKNRS